MGDLFLSVINLFFYSVTFNVMETGLVKMVHSSI